jgi:hypothetical protein
LTSVIGSFLSQSMDCWVIFECIIHPCIWQTFLSMESVFLPHWCFLSRFLLEIPNLRKCGQQWPKHHSNNCDVVQTVDLDEPVTVYCAACTAGYNNMKRNGSPGPLTHGWLCPCTYRYY